MRLAFTKFLANLKQQRLKTTMFFVFFAAMSTLISKYIYVNTWHLNLAIGTGICTFIGVWLLHYFIFTWSKSPKLKYLSLLAFPPLYSGLLISGFATFTTIKDLVWFQVPLINQVYLQMWAFLGDAYIYAVFSPKIPLFLTCLLVVLSFFFALKQSHTQPKQD